METVKIPKILLTLLVQCSLIGITGCSDDESEAPLPEVEASFDADKTELSVGDKVVFSSTSSGDPTIFIWTFEGGSPTTSGDENPEVTYNAAGTYDVSLVAANAQNEDEIVKTGFITVYENLAAQFGVEDSVILRGQTISFLNRSIGEITGYTWNFEGGTPQASSEENPQVTYTDLGVFDVSLKVTGFGGENENTAADVITVLDSVEAFFETGTQTIEAGSQLTFSNNSTGNPTSYDWSFEGGSTSTSEDEEPTVQYFTPGRYDVQLIARHEADADTLLIEDYIEVVEILSAEFSSSADVIDQQETVTFTDESVGNPTSWAWEFEGGTPATSTDQNPTVTYDKPGNYSVQLIVTNQFRTEPITKNEFIKVKGLVGQFDFSNNLTDATGFGDIIDSSITPSFSYVGDRKGTANAAIDYNGAGFSDAGANRVITNEVTVSVWINTTATGSTFRALVEKFSGPNDYGFILAVSNGRMYFRGRDKSGNFRDSGPSVAINDGNWHHVAGVLTKNSTWQVWVDGTLSAEQVNNFAIPELPNSNFIFLGVSPNTSAQSYIGQFDDLKIINRAASASEIQVLASE